MQDSGTTIAKFAVNFWDREESRLDRLGTGRIAPTNEAATAMIRVDARWSWMVITALLLLALTLAADWFVLRSAFRSISTDGPAQ